MELDMALIMNCVQFHRRTGWRVECGECATLSKELRGVTLRAHSERNMLPLWHKAPPFDILGSKACPP